MTARTFLYRFPTAVYAVTTALVFVGFAMGLPAAARFDTKYWIAAVERFDAQRYVSIAQQGYDYDPQTQSSVAFFPAYPMVVRIASMLSLVSTGVTAIVVSNVFLGMAFVVFYRYLLGRSESQRVAIPAYSLLALAVYPTTFFFRVAYSEAMFLLVTGLALLAMQQQWRLVWIVFWVGLATATRPLGVALVPCFILHLWTRYPLARPWQNWPAWLSVPLACWGLLAYMAYQWIAFGEPLAFAKTQQHWTVIEIGGWTDRLVSLVSLEPVWSTYLPTSPYRWTPSNAPLPVLSELTFGNPIYLVSGVMLVLVGSWKGWLSDGETLLAVGLIAIAYGTRGYEWGMLSQGRFMAAVLPIYIVIGELLARVPRWAAGLVLLASCSLMLLYALQFAAGKTLL